MPLEVLLREDDADITIAGGIDHAFVRSSNSEANKTEENPRGTHVGGNLVFD